MSCRDISSPISWRMYVNVPRVTLKLEYHSSSGKDASTISNHAKEWGCIHTSLKRGGFRQPRIACSRPYCRRFNACKSSARDDLVSSLNCDRRFRFFKVTSHTIAFCTRESATFFLHSPPESGAEERLKSYVNRCHISAGTHKFKSAIQKSTLKKCEHTCRVNQVGCTQKSARVPKFCSIDIVKIKSTVTYFIGVCAKIKNECRANFICFI